MAHISEQGNVLTYIEGNIFGNTIAGLCYIAIGIFALYFRLEINTVMEEGFIFYLIIILCIVLGILVIASTGILTAVFDKGTNTLIYKIKTLFTQKETIYNLAQIKEVQFEKDYITDIGQTHGGYRSVSGSGQRPRLRLELKDGVIISLNRGWKIKSKFFNYGFMQNRGERSLGKTIALFLGLPLKDVYTSLSSNMSKKKQLNS